MTELKTQISTLLSSATQLITSPKTEDLQDLLDSHPDFPHCERYVVDLVNKIKSAVKDFNLKISKAELVSIYQKHSGKENANELRTEEIMSRLTR